MSMFGVLILPNLGTQYKRKASTASRMCIMGEKESQAAPLRKPSESGMYLGVDGKERPLHENVSVKVVSCNLTTSCNAPALSDQPRKTALFAHLVASRYEMPGEQLATMIGMYAMLISVERPISCSKNR